MIPNGSLSNTTIVNVSAMENRKLDLRIGVSYEANLAKTKEVLRQVVDANELIDEEIEWEPFYRSYVRTYLERDVAELINTKNLLKFSSFMRCLAFGKRKKRLLNL